MFGSLSGSAALEAFLEALESAELGCTFIVDRGTHLDRVYANEALARIMGIELGALMRLPPMDILPAEERARLASIRAEGGSITGIETRITRPDGTVVPVEVRMGFTRIDGARGTAVFMRDLSAKASIEEALRLSEERFRSVAEASRDSITVYSNGRYLYANPIALRYLGMQSLAELEGFDPRTRFAPERRAALDAMAARMASGETIPPMEHRIPAHGPEGKEVIVESSISITTIGGEPAIVSFSRDITERIRLQAEVMKKDRLASVGMLAAGVAHELNNPLTSLHMQARKLREIAVARGLDADVRTSLEQIDEAASRMNAIISDLLFMARPVDKPQAHVDLAQILRSTIALLRAGTARCPVIHTELEGLPPIQGYASKVGQVFLNVLRNATQAVEGSESGAIRVAARVADDAIEIAISDNGVGIPPELVPRVTDPFFTTKSQGTGLGLWISHALMAEHGGTLDLRSTVGTGTTVTLSFPQRLPMRGP